MKRETVFLLVICFFCAFTLLVGVIAACSIRGPRSALEFSGEIARFGKGSRVLFRYVDKELGIACYHMCYSNEISCVQIDRERIER